MRDPVNEVRYHKSRSARRSREEDRVRHNGEFVHVSVNAYFFKPKDVRDMRVTDVAFESILRQELKHRVDILATYHV